MAKLWAKNIDLDKTIERFTVGDDYVLDLELAEADVLGNIAQARMLAKIGVLTDEELSAVHGELLQTLASIERGEFTIAREQEDVHTAVEERLTAALGATGKKIHTARSRNDQVALDCRLYAREKLLLLAGDIQALARKFLAFAGRHAEVPMVGRTHTQRAMPSSVGLWASSFAEGLIECDELLEAVYRLVNRSPLGSAASYGVAVDIDREMTASELGFERPLINVLYANNTRGKIEAEILCACAVLMNDLSKAAADVIFFSLPEIGYFILPERFCGGSSIMPQKKNPAMMELTRARAATVAGHLMAVLGIVRGLPSGYNRDFQDTKGPMIKGLATTLDCVRVMGMVIGELKVDAKRCVDAFSPDVFAADEALRLVTEEGVPFRDAYKRVGLNLDKLKDVDPVANIHAKKHLGAPGNLALDRIEKLLTDRESAVASEVARIEKVKERLTTL